MISSLQSRPGHVGWLPGRMIVRLTIGGQLQNVEHKSHRPANIRAADILAVLWEVWTPEQLAQQMEQRRIPE